MTDASGLLGLGVTHLPDRIQDPSPHRSRRTWMLVGAMAVALLLRTHTFHEPVDCDEAVYAYIAETMLTGGLPYRDAWGDPKPPGAPFVYAVGIAIGGANESTIGWIPVPFVLATVWLVWRVASRLAGPMAGLLAAWLFALASSDPFTFANGSNTEIYINCLALAGLDRLLASRDRRPLLNAVAAGAAIGLASLFKQVAVLHLLVFGVAGWLAWRDPDGRRAPVRRVAAMLAGAAGPWILVCVWAVAHGWSYLTDDFLYTVVLYPLALGRESGAGLFSRLSGFFSTGHIQALKGTWPLWAGGGMGALLLAVGRRQWATLATVAWALSCLVQIGLPGFYWPHYYMLGLPAMAVLTAVGVTAVASARTRRPGRLAALAGIVFGLAIAWIQWHAYLAKTPEEISRDHQGPQWVGCRTIGRGLASVIPEDDTLFVWGIQAPLYFYSGRRAPTRFFFADPVTERNPLATDGFHGRMKRVIMADLRRRAPALVWSKIRFFPELQQFLRDGAYVPAGPPMPVVGALGEHRPLFFVRRDLAGPPRRP